MKTYRKETKEEQNKKGFEALVEVARLDRVEDVGALNEELEARTKHLHTI
jgi:hypothetical protein